MRSVWNSTRTPKKTDTGYLSNRIALFKKQGNAVENMPTASLFAHIHVFFAAGGRSLREYASGCLGFYWC
jgi:hypothetical protein